jgi:hypothetical protein
VTKSAPTTGPLPDGYRDRLDWSKFGPMLRRVLAGQPAGVRDEILSRPDVAYRARGFNADGYCVVELPVARDDSEDSEVYWSEMFRFHWSRLLPPWALNDPRNN